MTRYTLWFSVVVAALSTAVTVTIQLRANEQLRLRDRAMREQGEKFATLTTDYERLRKLADRTANRPQLSQRQLRELMLLRDETRRLRESTNERSRLERRNEQLRTAAAEVRQRTAEAQADPRYWPKEHLAFAGFAEPQAAMQSILWAMKRSDLSFYQTAMTPQGRAMLDRQWDRKGASEAQRLSEMKMMAEAMIGEANGFVISDQTMNGLDEAILDVIFVGEDKTRKFVLRQIDGQWKLHAFLADGQALPKRETTEH